MAPDHPGTQGVRKLLKVKAIKTLACQLQANGLVERFNETLKTMMLRKFAELEPHKWHAGFPFLLFAIREVPQACLGFSPFELSYSRH